MPGDDDPGRVAAVLRRVAPDPCQRRLLLANDGLDARGGGERIVRHDHECARGDEGRGDERSVAFVERASVMNEKRADGLDVLQLAEPHLDRVGPFGPVGQIAERERKNRHRSGDQNALLNLHACLP